jgi:hypothetical protein
MKRVEREDILDYVTYGECRDALRRDAMEAKNARRVHVGEHLTFLFENAETIRYQVQEMIRAERIVRDADIRHELDTYNELLGAAGELGATLLIEIDDAAQRDEKLTRWIDLPRHVYVELPGGRRVIARYDERQLSRDRLSAVQYVKFATGGDVPVAVGCDHPDLTARTVLSPIQRAALEKDLAS